MSIWSLFIGYERDITRSAVQKLDLVADFNLAVFGDGSDSEPNVPVITKPSDEFMQGYQTLHREIMLKAQDVTWKVGAHMYQSIRGFTPIPAFRNERVKDQANDYIRAFVSHYRAFLHEEQTDEFKEWAADPRQKSFPIPNWQNHLYKIFRMVYPDLGEMLEKQTYLDGRLTTLMDAHTYDQGNQGKISVEQVRRDIYLHKAVNFVYTQARNEYARTVPRAEDLLITN
jgi:hypothetical protein|tara:strand:+ start:11979 stop:12662 length:684 start_codon:yes stop_codon:yes gene_type:complete